MFEDLIKTSGDQNSLKRSLETFFFEATVYQFDQTVCSLRLILLIYRASHTSRWTETGRAPPGKYILQRLTCLIG